MRIRTNHAGFSVVEVTVLAVVVVALGFVAFTVYNRQNTKTTSSTSVAGSAKQNSKASDVAVSPNVKSTADLDKAANTLDQTDPAGSNNSDAAELDQQLATF